MSEFFGVLGLLCLLACCFCCCCLHSRPGGSGGGGGGGGWGEFSPGQVMAGFWAQRHFGVALVDTRPISRLEYLNKGFNLMSMNTLAAVRLGYFRHVQPGRIR